MSFKYNARLIRVVDGDTVELEVDVGFKIQVRETFRLNLINAPEMRTPEGPIAKDWLTMKLAMMDTPAPYPLAIESFKKDKYGRWLVTIYDGDVSVNQQMLDVGMAVLY